MTTFQHIQLTAAAGTPDFANGSVYFIGNATLLIRFAGFTILTDPTFIHMHEQVSIGYGMQSTRLTNPAMEMEKGTAVLRITSTPGRHGPPLSELVLPDVMGSILEFQSGSDGTLYRIYITGDTLVFDDIREIPRRFPDIDLAFLHLGGTRVLGIMVTMDAKQGIEMMHIVNPDRAIPIHYNDFDVFKSPLSDFKREVESAGLWGRVHYLNHGETYEFAPKSRQPG